ncbi:MAG: hypothetical protein HS113_13695 [Verrucomicrobiales bacterium]|nr:hypothetical protein [Verrucomicrobiales bacterium]
MAFLWFEAPSLGGWAVARLALGSYVITPGSQPLVRRARAGTHASFQARLVGSRTPTGAERWALCSPPHGIRVNGDPVCLGLRVLEDHDEIQAGPGERLFFSAERLAEIVAFPGGPRPVHCPRCHQLIEPGHLAVQCPGCQTWHHQSDQLPCWSYDARCALCPQPTALDAGLSWTPEQAHA